MSDRFKNCLAQKIYIHLFLNKRPVKNIHAIDTKYNNTKHLLTNHTVKQFGYDHGSFSTDYLNGLRKNKHRHDGCYLDYCRTPKADFVPKDMLACDRAGFKEVYATFSLRNAGTKRQWRKRLKEIIQGTKYKLAWVYPYNDTSPMILACYYKHNKPKPLFNPVGKKFKYRVGRNIYHRVCKKLLNGPEDDPDNLYLNFRDSNEPWKLCARA